MTLKCQNLWYILRTKKLNEATGTITVDLAGPVSYLQGQNGYTFHDHNKKSVCEQRPRSEMTVGTLLPSFRILQHGEDNEIQGGQGQRAGLNWPIRVGMRTVNGQCSQARHLNSMPCRDRWCQWVEHDVLRKEMDG